MRLFVTYRSILRAGPEWWSVLYLINDLQP